MPLRPLGYAALIDRFALRVPAPRERYEAADGTSTVARTEAPDGSVRVVLPAARVTRGDTVADHLTFALKRENLDLGVLAALFEQPEALEAVQAWLARTPMSAYARRAAHLAAWLNDVRFDYCLPPGTPRVRVLDPGRYVTGPERPDRIFGVVHNLLGPPAFCPVVRRTPALERWLAVDLPGRVREALATIEPRVLDRAVDYLYLSETRSTYDIEQEVADNNRMARFRHLLELAGEPGRLSEDLLVHWQNQLLDPLRAEFGYRQVQDWLARPGRWQSRAEYVPPSPDDVPSMMAGVAELASGAAEGTIPLLVAAACASFGLVFVHPFLDGNGRLHRLLIHHVLRQAGATPRAAVLPVSTQMLHRIEHYARLLRHYSAPRTALLEYQLDAQSGTIRVTSPQPRRLYAYFDATALCEFLGECCMHCIEHDLPEEAAYLEAYDRTVRALEAWLDLPQPRLATLIDVIVQGGGKLSRRKRSLAEGLDDAALARVEEAVGQHFAEVIAAHQPLRYTLSPARGRGPG